MRGQEGPSDPGRRALLRTSALLVGLGAASALTGCSGIRLEDDAPHLPLPVRHPVDAEDALLALLGDLRGLASLTAAGTTAAVEALSALHESQAEVLRDALLRGGVPDGLVAAAQPAPPAAGTTAATSAPAAAGTSAATESTSSPASARPPVPPTEAGRAERSVLDLATAAPLMRCSAELRPTIVAVLAQRASAAGRLGTAPDWGSIAPPDPQRAAREAQAVDAAATASPTTGPATTSAADGTTTSGSSGASGAATSPGTSDPSDSPAQATHPVPADLAARLLESARATAYAMEVVAGQIETTRTANAKATLAQVRQTIAELEDIAADKAPAPELGYTLPTPVTTSAKAVTLARSALTAHRSAVAAAVASASDETFTPAAGLHLVRWLCEADRWAIAWGTPARAFPGMSNDPATSTPSASAPSGPTSPTAGAGTESTSEPSTSEPSTSASST
ncbi:hypothetical protein ACQP1U_12230 [Actinomycetota bacterium]